MMSVDISSPITVLSKRGSNEIDYSTSSSCKRTAVSPPAESYDIGRKKRSRALGFNEQDDEQLKDRPMYTQRQVEFFEQRKQAEMAKLRHDCEMMLMRKDQEVAAFRKEIQAVQQAKAASVAEGEKLSNENKILRRAVSIQNQQKEESMQEARVMKNFLEQAAEHIKRLEQSNYALRIHLQQTGNGASNTGSQPPDVF